MYDTVRFRFPATTPDRARILGLLTGNVFEKTTLKTGRRTVVGMIEGFRVSVHDESVGVQGSYTGFVMGTNGLNMDFEDVCEGAERLRGLFGRACDDGVVTRLDIGASLFVTRPTAAYTAALADAPRLDRLEQPNGGVLYRNKTRQMLFYDKSAQMLDVHGFDMGGECLRYEARWMQRPARAFGGGVRELRLRSLYDPRVFRFLVGRWRSAFSEIRTIPEPERPPAPAALFKNPKTFAAKMFARGVQSEFGDVQTALSALRAAYRAGDVTKHGFYRMQTAITGADYHGFQNGASDAESPISELRRKITSTAFEMTDPNPTMDFALQGH